MEFIIALASGLTLGCIHAFDVDHVLAVTAFASKNPTPGKAIHFGILWGLGHTSTVFIVGILSLALKFVISPHLQSLAEITVGVLLVAIGTWVLAGVLRRKEIHVHKHVHDGQEHIHFHSHDHSTDHHHKHSMFLVGATHGFAGTAAVMVIVPLTFSQSIGAAALFLLLFGLGTTIAMAIFALFIGTLAQKLPAARYQRAFQGTAGVISICVGLLWIIRRV